ncbi:MAG: hypothetical protein AAF561_16575, partial [Planctomycetota bacterium]
MLTTSLPDATFGTDGTVAFEVPLYKDGRFLLDAIELDASGQVDMSCGDASSKEVAVPGDEMFNITSSDLIIADNDEVYITRYRSLTGAFVMKLVQPPPPTVSIEAGILTITGTPHADSVEIENLFDGNVAVRLNGNEQLFSIDAFSQVAVHLLEGDDDLTVRQVLFRPVLFDGGDGSDRVFVEGSAGSDDDAVVTDLKIEGGGNNVGYTNVELI